MEGEPGLGDVFCCLLSCGIHLCHWETLSPLHCPRGVLLSVNASPKGSLHTELLPRRLGFKWYLDGKGHHAPIVLWLLLRCQGTLPCRLAPFPQEARPQAAVPMHVASSLLGERESWRRRCLGPLRLMCPRLRPSPNVTEGAAGSALPMRPCEMSS